MPTRRDPGSTLLVPSGGKANKVAIALAARQAMQEHRRGKPVAFPSNWRPSGGKA